MNAYGFDVTEAYARDLAAFVRKPARRPRMLASGNAQQAMDTIKEIYGVRVTADYANDLLAFAEKAGI